MPHPNNKRLRRANYSNSRTHYSMANSLVNTNRTPIWEKIIEGRNKIDKRVDEDVRVLGGTGHSLGDAASTGTIQIQSDAATNAGGDRKLVLGENTISFGYEFTLANSNEFVATTAQTRNFKITPTGNVLAQLQNGKIKVGDIFEVSGGEDNTNGGATPANKDERWINSVYRVTHIKDTNDADVAKHADAAYFVIDNDNDDGAVDLTRADAANTAGLVPHADAKIKFRKLVRVNKFESGGNEFFYLE